MISHLSDSISPPKRALILQADWEGGMCKVARDLINNGVEVTKVVFCAADKLYHLKGIDTVAYNEPLLQFEAWLRNYVSKNGIDTLILYNQFRPYNAIGWDLAEQVDIECLVFELGLLRPDFSTVYSRKTEPFKLFAEEWDGMVNMPLPKEQLEDPIRVARSDSAIKLIKMGFWVLITRFLMLFGVYRLFIDQRKLGIRHHLIALFRSIYRYYRRAYQKEMKNEYWEEKKGSYFIAPLQVHCDSQITLKSDFVTMEQFIRSVAESFLENAPDDQTLIFKVHPIDRGYKDYSTLIDQLNRACGSERFLYLDRIHLPTALKNASGCITINSSVGISGLIHDCPTICLGRAVYDLPGLTYQDGLDTFWENAQPAPKENVKTFVYYLKQTSQAQGVLYQDIFQLNTESKIHWPPLYKELFTFQPKKHNVTLSYDNSPIQESFRATTEPL